MTLVVVGDMDRTVGVAAVASVVSGERVQFTSQALTGAISRAVEGCGLSGTAEIEPIDPDSVFEGDGFVVAMPQTEIARMLEQHREELAGKRVLLAPGGFAGALVFAERFRQWGLPVPEFSEAPGWIAGGVLNDTTVRLVIRKRRLQLAASTDELTASAVAYFGRYIPDLVASDLVSTSLSNVNSTIHPPLAILNATRIQNAEDWYYWDEGFSPAVERVMLAIDQERMDLVAHLHGTTESLLESALSSYSADGLRGETYFDAIKSFDAYRARSGPKSLESRFLTDDVRFGLAAYEALAKRFGVRHSTTAAVRVLAETLLGHELSPDAAAVEALAAYAIGRRAHRNDGAA
jgi:opine dehydrogenase